MRLTHYPFAEHPAGGHDQGRNDRDEKLGNTENESKGSTAACLIPHDGDVERTTAHKSKSDKEEK